MSSLTKTSPLLAPGSKLSWLLWSLPLLYLWFRLINNLRTEWETNPQYSYGYIVPFLCLGLLLHRWQGQGKAEIGKVETRNPAPASASRFSFQVSEFQFSTFCFLLFALLSFLYLPTRLVELATPEWRPIQWSLGFIAVGLTLTTIYFTRGGPGLKQLAFPICFFLVAIPWPTLIEQPIIQTLTRINAGLVIEVMGLLGVPAMQHGNVIEVGTGVVGIDEACSGIRSFQSSLMISLFLGALYQLSPFRRVLFVPIGFVLAMLFNLGRTSFLTWVAAKQGVAAIDKYHDPAGLWIMVGCTVGLWGVGMLMKGKKTKEEIGKQEDEIEKAESGNQKVDHDGEQKSAVSDQSSQAGRPISAFRSPLSTVSSPVSAFSISAFQRLSMVLIAWLIFAEFGSSAWYRSREAGLTMPPNWTLVFPEDNPTFKDLPIATNTFDLLRFDDGKQASWIETNGLQLSAFYFNWQPGRVAGYLAKRHTPEICMPATGRAQLFGPELMVVKVHGLALPIRRYRFGPDGNSLHVYHCRWEAGATESSFVEQDSARLNLIRAIWNGRGNQGQKVIEFIISGTEDPEEAKALLVRRLEDLIQVAGETKPES